MRSYDAYVPNTFEQRGVFLSFTTPQLAYSRVRKDYRERLEIVMQNISDGEANYVIPWGSLAQTVTLTVHDRILQDKIQSLQAILPVEIRAVQLRVARDGLAGDQVASAAEKSLETEEKQVGWTRQALLSAILKEIGRKEIGAGPSETAGPAPVEATDRDTGETLRKAAVAVGMEEGALDRELYRLARIVAPLGIAGSPEPGRLRRLTDELDGYHSSLEQWIEKTPHGDILGFERTCLDITRLTVALGKNIIGELDASMLGSILLLQRRDAAAKLEAGIGRLSWLLDGWEMIIRTWEAARDDDRHAQQNALSTIYRGLPLLPKSELPETHLDGVERVRVRKGGVRMYANWHGGELDYDLLARIETTKAKLT